VTANDITANILQRDAKAGEMIPVQISNAYLDCRIDAQMEQRRIREEMEQVDIARRKEDRVWQERVNEREGRAGVA
jgi:hypothetical protein